MQIFSQKELFLRKIVKRDNMKKILLSLCLVLTLLPALHADEGMWILSLIGKNYNQMKAQGFRLSAEDIYSINKACLKDAVVALDHGSCTAEVVSPQGLLFTNHHCGYSEIQSHSTMEHNYLADGFWAKSLEEELPNPGKTVSFLVSIEDVTQKILAAIPENATEEQRQEILEEQREEMKNQFSENGKYEIEVNNFFFGNYYYMLKYIVYKDIRLVGAPPESVGKYGGDTDNWMWPRHTVDFSIFRVYTAPDGSPAEYSEKNVPLKAKSYLPISLKGVNDGDFAMVIGYPGSTDRYLTSWGVKRLMNNENNIRVEVRDAKLKIFKEYMDKDKATKLQYASKYATSSNYYKYSIGQNLGLTNLKVYDRKVKIEKNLKKWIDASPDRQAKYSKIFDIMPQAYNEGDNTDKALNYWFESIYLGPEIIKFCYEHFPLYYYSIQERLQETESELEKIKNNKDMFFKDFNVEIDKKLMKTMLKIYKEKVDKEFQPEFLPTLTDKQLDSFIDTCYNNSFFCNKDSYEEFILMPNIQKMQEDPMFALMREFFTIYYTISDKNDIYENKINQGMNLFTDAYIKMTAEKNPNKQLYPDANSTMRLTYGNVKSYKTKGKKYNYYTTFDELIAKEDTENPEFYVQPRLKQLYNAKDFGQYAQDGTIRVCFITTNDITGGNSGSPCINADGELIGLAFDGNWEAMSGDVIFEPTLQRCIVTDIRFVLFMIDKYAGAQNIINELTIRK